MIPSEIRERANLKAGDEIVVVEKAGIICLVSQKPIKQMRGFVKGGDAQNIREEKGVFDSNRLIRLVRILP